jgi:hypothetical protein
MSFHIPSVQRDVRFWVSTLLHVNKDKKWYILTWCWMVSAEHQIFREDDLFGVEPDRAAG